MIKPTGENLTAEEIAATAQRMEETGMRLLGRLAQAMQQAGSDDAAAILSDLETDARRRLKQYADKQDSADFPPPPEPPPPPLPTDEAWEIALDLCMHSVSLYEVLEALADDDAARNEAARLAADKKQLMAEIDRRRKAAPVK